MVIYSTDPPALSSLITNERKETERSKGGVMVEKQGRAADRTGLRWEREKLYGKARERDRKDVMF